MLQYIEPEQVGVDDTYGNTMHVALIIIYGSVEEQHPQSIT